MRFYIGAIIANVVWVGALSASQAAGVSVYSSSEYSPRMTSQELIEHYQKKEGYTITTKECVFKKFSIPDSFYEKFLKGQYKTQLGTKKIQDANDKNMWHRCDFIMVKFEDPTQEPCFLFKEE